MKARKNTFHTYRELDKKHEATVNTVRLFEDIVIIKISKCIGEDNNVCRKLFSEQIYTS